MNYLNLQKYTYYNISVVIPCYPPHITHLRSTCYDILRQTILPKEVIIAISGITDAYKNKLLEFFKRIFVYTKVDLIMIHTKKDQPAGINRNMGASVAKYDYVMFIDADDQLHPLKIEVTKYFINKYSPNIFLHSYLQNYSQKQFQQINIRYTNTPIINNEKIYTDTLENKRNLKRSYLHFQICNRKKKGYYYIARGYPTIKKSLLQTYQYDDSPRGQDTKYLVNILHNLGPSNQIVYVDLPLINYHYVDKRPKNSN